MSQIYIAIPCHAGQLTVQCTLSLNRLTAALAKRDVGYEIGVVCGSAIVHEARNELVASFLASEANTHLLFLDADIQFEPEDVLAMLDAGKGVIAGACALKRYDWARVRTAAARGAGDLESEAVDLNVHFDLERAVLTENPDGSVLASWGSDACVPVVHAGTGFMLIERRVIAAVIEQEQAKAREARQALERLVSSATLGKQRAAKAWAETVRRLLPPDIAYTRAGRPQHAVFDTAIRAGRFVGEDFLFCERVREIGETVWLYAPARTGHVGGMCVFRKVLGTGFNVRFPSMESFQKKAAVETPAVRGRPPKEPATHLSRTIP